MTTRLQLIAKVNRQLKDGEVLQTFSATANGTDTVISLCSNPILSESEVIKFNGVQKTSDTDYTIDNETGRASFTSTPASGTTITGSFKGCNYSPQAKIDMLNHTLTGGFLREEVIDDYSCVPNGKVISTFESSETWTTGAADTFKFKTGTQGLRIGSGTNSRTVTGDYRGRNTDRFKFYVYCNDSSLVTSAILRLHTTAGTNYYSNTFTSFLQDGWNVVDISRGDFTATGSPDWQSIVRIDFVYTGTAHVSVDQLVLVYGDTSNTIDLPSGVWKVLDVKLYASNGEDFITIRTYRLKKGSGQGGVNQLQFENKLIGRKLEIRYVKSFNNLDTDGEVTDLPAEGEMAAVLKTAADILVTEEPTRLLSGKRLGYKGDSDGAKEMSHITLSERLEQKAIRERARAGLAYFAGTTTIHNN